MKAAAYPHQMVGVPKTTEGTPHLRSSGYGGPPKGGSPKFRDTRGLAAVKYNYKALWPLRAEAYLWGC